MLYGLLTHQLVSLKQPAPAAEKPTQSPAASDPNTDTLLGLLEKIKSICNATLGKQGEAVVDKQYQKAKIDIEKGAGMGAIQEAVTQIAKASSILKGPSTTELLLDQLKTLKL